RFLKLDRGHGRRQQPFETPGVALRYAKGRPLVETRVTQQIVSSGMFFADNRDDLVAATRALGRVLLWNHYVVPHWNFGHLRTAHWDKFGHPKNMPKYGISAFPELWWCPARPARTGRGDRP